ncbi:MAG: flagellar motor switch protein FliN [Porticoccus sp.]|uniref:flagellar motor switch protein FliN n=1 Tax=Porticoccus TaxID=1123967 RepID=UPI002353EFE4|nr:flagellar motor switch protein FliN [Porticoccus hydrocarbonoclasticus]|tara:strand:+ start:6619 stop:7002 length:384 start_codon:yes stop_codon:yes gene_type:complete
MNDQVDETKPQSPQPGSGTEESVPLKELEAEDSRSVPEGGGEINLDALLDVQVTLSVEIGRSRLPIKDLIALNQGSVVELDREMDEPLDLMVNGTLIARGEVVVVDGQFGLRLVDIVSPSERLKKLK